MASHVGSAGRRGRWGTPTMALRIRIPREWTDKETAHAVSLLVYSRGIRICSVRKVDIGLHGKGNSKLLWRKAGQPSHLVDVVDSDQ